MSASLARSDPSAEEQRDDWRDGHDHDRGESPKHASTLLGRPAVQLRELWVTKRGQIEQIAHAVFPSSFAELLTVTGGEAADVV